MTPWIVRSGPATRTPPMVLDRERVNGVRDVPIPMMLTIEREISLATSADGHNVAVREILASVTVTAGFEALMRRAYDVMCSALNAAELEWPETG